MDLDDQESVQYQASGGEDSDDDNFIPPDSDAEEENDDDDPIKPEEVNSDAEYDSYPRRKGKRKTAGRQAKRQLPKQPQAQQSGQSPGNDANALAQYPHSARLTQTRWYHGVLGGWIRICFCEDFYGPDKGAVAAAEAMVSRWRHYEVLPSKLLDQDKCPQPTPWVADDFEWTQALAQRDWFCRFWDHLRREGKGQTARGLSADEASPYLVRPVAELRVLMGPHTSHASQREFTFSYHQSITLGHDGLPFGASGDASSDANGGANRSGGQPAGWMFDVGGIVTFMAWAPRAKSITQILALAAIPHTDQDVDAREAAAHTPSNEEQKRGIVQLWEFQGFQGDNGVMYPSKEPPRLVQTLCFDWGRVKKVEWCPVPSVVDHHLGVLAVLSGDGQVHVLSVEEPGEDELSAYEKIDKPLVSLGYEDEKTSVEVTCFSWAGINRIVTGHSDGSVALWSLAPRCCLARQPVHSTHVINIASAYPSHPHVVASAAVSGFMTLLDLLDPGSESSCQTNPSTVTQSNLLQWSDHLQGFFSLTASTSPLNTTVSFVHSRTFAATMRKVMDGDAAPTALAVGCHHPFLLVALLDGSVWACNPMNRIFAPRHYPPGQKVKILEHEHVPAARLHNPTPVLAEKNGDTGATSAAAAARELPFRGVSRILQGFGAILNHGHRALIHMGQAHKKTKSTRKRVRRKPTVDGGEAGGDMEGNAAGDGDGEGDGEFGLYSDPTKIILREPLSRTTAMAWNPNIDFACWAGIAMASGLVRVLDMGVDH
ncbi:hypothetical protein SODALDRAFT_291873 [Sodiomyces alkalinus F11]|uniref:WD40 repeat-like protein n=1 Tax=Sodiomyces alkalinus (strain CBS 110278 / VKM F-3762 / F11) TaxID=1314773 RepID=A0A3N2Q3H1_SODAK|nr:hypothetical protein SODALDRAFT_291873 [Sodiomyces alkalinus F11]ROT41266.1 hypothetical protein SODALDRAFT_291873 [Sodiomyces alkalinus F11]